MGKEKDVEPSEIVDRIVDAAKELILEKGIEHLNIRDICSRARVSVGTFYNYYPSKGELLLSRVFSMDDSIERDIIPTLHGSASDKLMQIFLGYSNNVRKRGWEYCTEVFSFIQKHHVTVDEDMVRSMYRFIYKIVDEGQKSGEFTSVVSAQELTFMSITFIRGLGTEWCRKSGGYDIMDYTEIAGSIWVTGMNMK